MSATRAPWLVATVAVAGCGGTRATAPSGAADPGASAPAASPFDLSCAVDDDCVIATHCCSMQAYAVNRTQAEIFASQCADRECAAAPTSTIPAPAATRCSAGQCVATDPP